MTLGGSLVPGGLLTLGGSDASGRIGDAFLLGGAVGDAGAAGVPGSLSLLVMGCLVAAMAAALGESLDTNVDDNILVPLVGGAVLWVATLVDPGLLVAGGAAATGVGGALAAADGSWLTGVAITVPVTVMAYFARAVDRSGAVVGVLLATVLYVYAAWPGLVMLGGLMVIGMGVTRLGHARKEALGLAEGRGGRRGLGSVAANAGAVWRSHSWRRRHLIPRRSASRWSLPSPPRCSTLQRPSSGRLSGATTYWSRPGGPSQRAPRGGCRWRARLRAFWRQPALRAWAGRRA